MPNVEFIARNGIVSRGNLVVSGSVISTSPASFSGSLSVTGSIVSTNNIQGNQFSSTVGSVIGGRYFSDVLIAAGTVTYGSYGTSNVANFDIYANNENVGNGAQLRLSSRFGGDNGAYLVSSLTGSVVLAVNGTGNSGLVLNGSTMNVGIGVSTPTGRLQVRGSGTTSSTTAFLVQNANASSSFSIKDNGDSTFTYPGIGGYSLKISGSYSGNGASAIYETLGATGGYFGIHEFRIGTNTANAIRAMSIVYGGRVVIGNKSDTVLQHPGANLFVDTNVVNAFTSQSFNTGITINPSGSLNTSFTASGIQFNFAANSPNDTNGGVFVGSQYNPATNGYDSDLVIYNSQGLAGSYVETARFVGKSRSLSLGAGRNPSASLHISGSSNSALFEIDSPTANNIIFVSGSGNVGIGTGTPTATLHVSGSARLGDITFATSGTFETVTLSRATLTSNLGGDNQFTLTTNPGTNTFINVGYGNLNLNTGISAAGSIALGGVRGRVLTFGGGEDYIGCADGTGGNFSTRISSYSNIEFGPTSGFPDSFVTRYTMTSTGFGIYVPAPTARLQVKGSGATSSTTGLLVQNSNGSSSLQVLDNGNVGIGGDAIAASYKLRVYGSIWADSFDQLSALNGNAGVGKIQYYDDGATLLMRVYGPHSSEAVKGILTLDRQDLQYTTLANSITHTASFFMDHPSFVIRSNNTSADSFFLQNYMYASGALFVTNQPAGGDTSFRFRPSASLVGSTDVFVINTSGAQVTGNLSVTSPASTGSALYAYKSGSTVLDIQGSQGQLFSVIDALSGSLMSVNDISGLPILEVFSDDRVVMGTYGAPAVIISGSNTVISGSLRGRVVTLSTASATASMDCSLSNFFDLTLSGSMYLTPTNILPGETINLRITQPATSGSLNYTSSIKFPNGLPYTASATSSVVDLVSFISFDSSTLYATAIKNLV
jgi:hypothetical protein